ncbi:hypothetical protein BU26DRAFT_609192 [Trematosphaeria pertusa]|uniref:DUF2264 domain-containing protein n=1 Tax=Trematosphaeria pertusa TaxID=390896 RepID=A0A6A6I2V0_9PLEO|nr:uncharacterized protein BU26DRAFT_609192 [Trematosphaeria pertusa]KAF2243900.1 hypothetical protein BU26DRAFT_609192 [Trematosphaeria pertusa]
MPRLCGFSHSSFESHADFKQACIALLRALQPYQSPGGARIKLPLATGTHFDEIAAQLEGFARPLWAIGALVHGGTLTKEEEEELVEPYVRGLANGTDPYHPEYWGPVVVRDQRMVEMEIISFALLTAPETLFGRQSPEAQGNIRDWLATINGKDFPVTNWLWFRVMTNLALVRVCGVPYEKLKSSMNADLDQMEQFYLGDGWAADGIWSDEGRQADYYSGSFAIQFSQLVYVKMAEDLDPARCKTFRERAAAFASSFWRYFDTNGAAIPFGRSLTYRFAFAGFWSAAAFAEVELPAPLNDRGLVKRLLLQHFRWWSNKFPEQDMFSADGTLTIGFAYPNMYMSEDYNSPQSPYWAMKSFVALGLPDVHPFWTAEEKPIHQSERRLATVVEPPMHIICHTSHHHFLLNMGQFCPWPLKATEAKYGKFAYSSHFGFSVPTGPLLPQMAPDSTLALSKDGGDTWRVPWKVERPRFSSVSLVTVDREPESVPTLSSVWRPWKDADIEVHTLLIASCTAWPDWHMRAHKIINKGTQPTKILAVPSGFAIQGRGSRHGEVLPSHADDARLFAWRKPTQILEGTLQSRDGALICSDAGMSGIRQPVFHGKSRLEEVRGEVLKPDANTNLMWQRTLIPTIRAETKVLEANEEAVLISGVFAIGKKTTYNELDLAKKWNDVPVICEKGSSSRREACIEIDLDTLV